MAGKHTPSPEPTTIAQEVNDEGEERSFDHEKAQRGVKLLLEAAGRDPTVDPLVETWQRRVPETLEVLTEGTRVATKPELVTFESDNEEFVIKTDIPLFSLCEHHLLPFHGRAHVGYRPNGRVVGLSKLVRYVRWQSRRLTIQERLTQSIAEGLADELDSPATLVSISAVHLCEAMRGVEVRSESETLAASGTPTEEERRRFLAERTGMAR